MKKTAAVIISAIILLTGCSTMRNPAPEVVVPPVIEEPAPVVSVPVAVEEEPVREPVIEQEPVIEEPPASEEAVTEVLPVGQEPVIEEIPEIGEEPAKPLEVDTQTELQEEELSEVAQQQAEPAVEIRVPEPEPEPVIIPGTSEWEVPVNEPEGTPWWIYAAIGGGAVVLVIIIAVIVKSAKKSRIRKNAAKVLPSYVVLETSTSALDPKHGKLIEIALKKYTNREESASYTSLINPGCWIPGEITGITGITDPMLVDAPALDEIWGEVKKFVDGQVIVGYNILFDLMFIKAETGEKLNNKIIEILPIVKKYLPDLTDYRLSTVAAALGIVKPRDNRAASNAELQSKILETFIDMSAEQGNPLVL